MQGGQQAGISSTGIVNYFPGNIGSDLVLLDPNFIDINNYWVNDGFSFPNNSPCSATGVSSFVFLDGTAATSPSYDINNDSPVASDDLDSTLENATVFTAVLDNDFDIDGVLDLSTLKVITSPTHGTAIEQNDGTIAYTPNSAPSLGLVGVGEYKYEICDNGDINGNNVLCDSAAVVVKIEP